MLLFAAVLGISGLVFARFNWLALEAGDGVVVHNLLSNERFCRDEVSRFVVSRAGFPWGRASRNTLFVVLTDGHEVDAHVFHRRKGLDASAGELNRWLSDRPGAG